jgi:hypothetical protein
MDALIHIAGTVIAGITWIPTGRKNVAKWEHHDLRNIVQLVTVQIGEWSAAETRVTPP